VAIVTLEIVYLAALFQTIAKLIHRLNKLQKKPSMRAIKTLKCISMKMKTKNLALPTVLFLKLLNTTFLKTNQRGFGPINPARVFKGNIMYEIIWSVFYDKYIVRPVPQMGNVKPLFIGTEAECTTALNNCNPH